jgi:hypothetical protein
MEVEVAEEETKAEVAEEKGEESRKLKMDIAGRTAFASIPVHPARTNSLAIKTPPLFPTNLEEKKKLGLRPSKREDSRKKSDG